MKTCTYLPTDIYIKSVCNDVLQNTNAWAVYTAWDFNFPLYFLYFVSMILFLRHQSTYFYSPQNIKTFFSPQRDWNWATSVFYSLGNTIQPFNYLDYKHPNIQHIIMQIFNVFSPCASTFFMSWLETGWGPSIRS